MGPNIPHRKSELWSFSEICQSRITIWINCQQSRLPQDAYRSAVLQEFGIPIAGKTGRMLKKIMIISFFILSFPKLLKNCISFITFEQLSAVLPQLSRQIKVCLDDFICGFKSSWRWVFDKFIGATINANYFGGQIYNSWRRRRLTN